MKISWAVLLLFAPLVALNAQSNPYEKVVQQAFPSGGTVRLHLEAGGYTIKAGASDNVVVTYPPNSSGRSSEVRVEIKTAPSRADVFVRNTPHSNFEAAIEIPAHSNLWVRLTAGELNVEGVEGDKDIELWAGQINVDVPHPDAYGHRDASVIAGSLEASAFHISKGGLFRSFSQAGPGKYRFHAHVTSGEIDVR
ncbi:MAG TPA: hypothetical protein VMI10_18580 [Terriglobales bacterium]|nr:hypothetical protein [Terriglobales bacterium]